jgi:tetratricopeptide (TPR) repeat protein
VDWQIRSAQSLLLMGDDADVESALRVLKSAESVERPTRPQLLYLLGRAERRAGNVDEAIEYLRRAQGAGWPARQVQEQIQLARIQRGHFEDLRQSLSGLTSGPASDEFAYEAYEAMAKGYLYAYRFADALHCLGYWIEWCPQAVEPRVMRAGIWEQSQDWKRAIEEYHEVLRIDPSHLKARLAMAGHMLLQLNQVQDACREFLYCLQEHPDDVSAVLGLAACERRLGAPQGAESRLRALLARRLTLEQRTNTQLQLGQILLDRGEPDEAAELLAQAVAADPRNSPAQYALGSAYAATGQADKAAACFGRSRVLQEQFSRLTDITTELVNHPERAELRWEAGRILMEQGLSAEGAAWLSTVLMYDPHHQPTHEALADYYETVKRDPRMAAHHRHAAQQAAGQALNHPLVHSPE